MPRVLKFVLLGLLLLVLFLVALGLSLPYLVNLKSVKGRVSQRLSESLQAEVSVKTLRLKIFLRPGLSAEGVRIKAPRYFLTVESLRLYPDIPALLRRRLVIRDFELLSPHLTLLLPEKGSGASWKPEEWLAKIPPLPPMELKISEGLVRVIKGPEVLWELKDLSAEVATRPEQILVEIRSRPSFAEKMRLKARLNLEATTAEGLLEASQMDLGFLSRLSVPIPLEIQRTNLSFTVAFTYEKGSLVAGFKARAPEVIFKRIPKYKLACEDLEGEFSYTPGNWEVTFKKLAFSEPRFEGEGQLLHNKEGFLLQAKIKEADFGGIRLRLGALFPEKRGLQKFLHLVRGGRFFDLEIKTRSRDFAGLFRIENLILSARVKEGVLHLKKPPLALSELSGTLTLVMGDLTFKGDGRLPKSTFSRSTVRLHLKDPEAPLLVETTFSGEARELLGVARGISAKVARALKDFTCSGPLTGWLKLSGTRQKPKVYLEVAPRGVQIVHPFWPAPISATGGRLIYQDKRCTLQGINLVGKGLRLQGLSMQLDTRRRPYTLKITELRGEVNYKILQQTLLKYSGFKDFVQKYRPEITKLRFKKVLFAGSLEPASLRERLSLELLIPEGSLYLPALERRIKLRKMPVSYQRGDLAFGPGEVFIGDAELLISGEIPSKKSLLFLRGSGRLGEGFLRWLYQKASLPEKYLLRSPLKIRDFSLTYASPELSLSVDLVTAGEANLSLEYTRKASSWKVSSGRLVHGEKVLTFTLERFPDHYLLGLKGELRPASLRALFPRPPRFEGYLKGDLHLKFYPERPLLSRFRGWLSGENFLLPVKGEPYIQRFHVKGDGRNFRFEEISLRLKDSDFKISGRVEVASKNFRIEGQVYSHRVNIPVLKEIFTASEGKGGSKGLRVTGHLGLVLEEVWLTSQRKLQDFKGDLIFLPERKMVTFSEARFCGLPLNGRYIWGKEKSLEIRTYKPSGDLATFFRCLSPSETVISGPFTLRAEIYLRGRKSLFEKGRGTLVLRSPQGTIHKFGLLAKIFGFLSPIDLFRGQVPSLEDKGFPYQKLGLEGRLKGNRFQVEKAFLEGPGLRLFASGDIYLPEGRLNLTVLVSPFKTVDTITSRIPVVGFLLTGKDRMLVSVPLKVKGPYRDPSIVPLHPEAIGEGIFGLFKRVFELPAEIVKPK